MISTAEETTKALGKTDGLSDEELNSLYYTIGMGALKYYLLKVEPKKKMMFNPAESIDFHGNTGPFIQYTHARLASILRNSKPDPTLFEMDQATLLPLEKKVISILSQYPKVVEDAGVGMSPGLIANYTYDLSKTFSQFYHELSILKEQNMHQRNLRLMIAALTAKVIRSSFGLLGIQVPERM